MDAKEQTAEVNRLRVEISKRMLGIGRVHPREFALAAIMLCIEMHVEASSMTKDEVRAALKGMVDFLLDHATIVRKNDIQ